MNYNKFLSKISRRRKPNLIRTMTESYMKNPDALFFAGGMPNVDMFPIKEINVTYSNGSQKTLAGADLHPALQYGPSQGYLPLLKKWREFQTKWHSPKYDDWDVQVTSGSMEGCSKIFELLLDEGEPIMVQSPTYTGILSALLPLNPDFIGIGTDDDGVLTSDIVNACEERLKSGKPVPKVLYVNPTGANPIGAVYSARRKEQIYELAQKYDFLIVEDDAYYFLHFLDEQPRSFLSIDTDGRVLRLDSCSKIFSAGLRLGFITGPKPLLSKILLHIASSTMHSSSLSQVLIYRLLDSWSDDEVEAHLSKVQDFYRSRRDIMLQAVEKYFSDIAEWSTPKGGMFVWLKLTGLNDVYDMVMDVCVPQGVFVMPGHAFFPDKSKPCQYLRLCYSMASPQDIDKGLSKISTLVRQTMKDKKSTKIALK